MKRSLRWCLTFLFTAWRVLLFATTSAAFGWWHDIQSRTPPHRPSRSTTASFVHDQKQQLSVPSSNATVRTPSVPLGYKSEAYEEYSRSLSIPTERKDAANGLEQSVSAPLNLSKRIRNAPGHIIQRAFSRKVPPGKLILLRCGESLFNANGTFTGWLDPDLTAVGVQQCKFAAQVLKAGGFEPDVVYTSRLTRAIKSAWHILEELDLLFIAVHKTVRLNQRMYGALQGLSRDETEAKVGAVTVHAWRNSLKARPPALSISDPTHPRFDRRYADLSSHEIPSTESLLDCQERAQPLWEHKIKKDIEDGKTVLVVGHRDALRGLVKSIDGVGETEIEDIRIPKCIPLIYRFQEVAFKGGASKSTLVPVAPDPVKSRIQQHTTAQLLETPASLKAAVSKLTAQEKISTDLSGSAILSLHKREVSLRDALSNLRSTNPALNHTAEVDDYADIESRLRAPAQLEYDGERWNDDPSEFEEYEYDEFDVADGPELVAANVVLIPEASEVKATTFPTSWPSNIRDGDSVVVLIRHGRTPHNNLGLFTGWEDPPLAEDGIEDAINAGKLLKR